MDCNFQQKKVTETINFIDVYGRKINVVIDFSSYSGNTQLMQIAVFDDKVSGTNKFDYIFSTEIELNKNKGFVSIEDMK